MSISALEALRVIELLDSDDNVVDLTSFQPIDIQKKLDYYRDTRIRSIEKDARNSISSSEDIATVVSSTSARNDVVSLLPSCFVYNRIYTNDPLLTLVRPEDEASDAYNPVFGMRMNSSGIDVASVGEALDYFHKLSPLIRIGAITVLPIEELVSPPRDPGKSLPIFYSKDWFRSEVPEHIHDFVHKRAIISEVAPIPNNGGFIIYERSPKSPTRGIAIQFKNDSPRVCPPFYLLSDLKVVDKINTSQVRIEQKVNWDNPPSQSSFDAWVYQSINQTIITRIRSIAREIGIASELRASYLTESQFEAELCGISFNTLSKPDTHTTAVNFLTANVPYLNTSDPKALSKLRTDNPRIFERWQHSLLAAIHELNGCDGDFNARAKQIFETEFQPQIDELRKALIRLSGGLGGSAFVTAGSIGLALLSSPMLPFAAVLGLGALVGVGKTLPSVTEYLAARKGPAFVWNQLASTGKGGS